MSTPTDEPMGPERLADLREQIDTIAQSRSEAPHESWTINDVGGVAILLADRDRLAAEVKRQSDLLACARVVTRADECELDCDEACPCIYCRSVSRLDAHFDGGSAGSSDARHRIDGFWDIIEASMSRDAGEGLAATHECGLVHRDIKPANDRFRYIRELIEGGMWPNITRAERDGLACLLADRDRLATEVKRLNEMRGDDAEAIERLEDERDHWHVEAERLADLSDCKPVAWRGG